MSTPKKIYVAGYRGMVGSAIVRYLLANGVKQAQIVTRTHAELDLTNQAAVQTFFAHEKPDQVYLAAAKVGGIHANNTYPAEFIYDNLMMQANIIDAAFRNGVKKLLFLGSSCIYPKLAPQPMREDALLTGTLESTNEPYAIAKIAGIKLCESYNRQYGASHGVDYRSVMPTNLYGPGDNYHPENSHVIPALIRRFHEAKLANAPSVAIWGTGTPKREFLYVDDMAAACVHVMNLDKSTYDQHTSPRAPIAKTTFSMVRFGNVLGSSGSVVPLFREQIKNGGPITLTHADITRYFMTIPEAAQLVVQAGAMGQGGDVFVLDMGQPVKIIDLARRMVELSGMTVRDELHPDGDIELTVTGLRPGEKLYEELLIGDNPKPTQHPRIMKAHEQFLSWADLEQKLNALSIAMSVNDVPVIRGMLQELVSGYQPSGEVVDWVHMALEREALANE